MKKAKHPKYTALKLLKEVLADVNDRKPSQEEMLKEVKMMNFKIRPVDGDIFNMMTKNVGFLESLWRIGRIEKIVIKAKDRLSFEEKELFFDYLDELEMQMQTKYDKLLDTVIPDEKKKAKLITLEVFKEAKFKKDIN